VPIHEARKKPALGVLLDNVEAACDAATVKEVGDQK
jgi:hypothetical protein